METTITPINEQIIRQSHNPFQAQIAEDAMAGPFKDRPGSLGGQLGISPTAAAEIALSYPEVHAEDAFIAWMDADMAARRRKP